MMDNEFPHFVRKGKDRYQLDLSYRLQSQYDTNSFEWSLAYVGDAGILYRAHNVNTDVLLKEFEKFCIECGVYKEIP